MLSDQIQPEATSLEQEAPAATLGVVSSSPSPGTDKDLPAATPTELPGESESVQGEGEMASSAEVNTSATNGVGSLEVPLSAEDDSEGAEQSTAVSDGGPTPGVLLRENKHGEEGGSAVEKPARPPSIAQVWDLLNSFGESNDSAPDTTGNKFEAEEAGLVVESELSNGPLESTTTSEPDEETPIKVEFPTENGLTMSACTQPSFGADSPEAQPKGKPRSGSDPVETSALSPYDPDSALHMSLMPDRVPTKTMSSENIMESDDLFDSSSMKRQASVPSQLSNRVSKSVTRAQAYKRALVRRLSMKTTMATRGKESTVQLLKTIPSQEWDPTCLMEELYDDHRRFQSNPSGEVARHFGYLEKLPVNRSKPKPFNVKGYKRRYFRAMDGNLYYYETRTAEKPLGFVRLPNAKFVANPQNLSLQVIEKGGSLLMMKAPNADELREWHRALQLESAHPTLVTPLSPMATSAEGNHVVVIDIGACSLRAGFATEDAYPQVYCPAVCAMDAATLDPIDCGLEAFLPQNRYEAKMIYPRRQGLRLDRSGEHALRLQATYSIIDSVFTKLNVEPQYCQVLLTLPPTIDEEQNNLADIILGQIGCAGFSFQEQALLALYSYSTTSGIMVDIGDHIDIVPVIDGFIIEAGVSRLPFGGNAITDHFSKLITAKGIRYFSDTEVYINRYLKESLCYVSENFEEDAAMCDANPSKYTRAADIDRFQLPDHKKVIYLDSSLFKAPEGLFNPRLWGKDVPGIHELVWKSIQQCPIDQRKELQRKIYLSGATTQLHGFKERLQKELLSLAQPGTVIEVHCSDVRQHAAFIGGTVLARLSSFQDTLVTKQDWEMLGSDALKKLRKS